MLLSIAIFLLPTLAHAEEATTWDFQNAQIPGEWSVAQTLTATRQTDGLALYAQDAGNLTRTMDVGHPVQVIRIVAKAPRDTDVSLVWRTRELPAGSLLNYHFLLPASDAPTAIELDPSAFKEWDPHGDIVGIGLMPGSDITLVSLELRGWNTLEQMAEAWRSFWVFDAFSSHTINFLWGPLVSFNSYARAHLFATDPPVAISANRYFYYAFALAALLIAGWWLFQGRHRSLAQGSLFRRAPQIAALFTVFAVLWLFYDTRMGLEFLSYASNDYTTWVRPPADQKVFRRYENIYRIVDAVVPRIMKEEHYGLLVPPNTNIYGVLKYRTYPVTPYEGDEDASAANVWVVIRRSDAHVDAQGRLTIGDKILSRPGRITQQFDNTSFLFDVLP